VTCCQGSLKEQHPRAASAEDSFGQCKTATDVDLPLNMNDLKVGALPGMIDEASFEIEKALQSDAMTATTEDDGSDSKDLKDMSGSKESFKEGGSKEDLPSLLVVTLAKSSGGKRLGLDFKVGDGRSLAVKAIANGGLVQDWNTCNPREQIAPGDCIVEVNGAKGDAHAMMDKCRTERVLRMTVRKAL